MYSFLMFIQGATSRRNVAVGCPAPTPLGIAHALPFIQRGARRNPFSFLAQKEKRVVRKKVLAMHAIVVAFLFQTCGP
jgi:hypothetical protein